MTPRQDSGAVAPQAREAWDPRDDVDPWETAYLRFETPAEEVRKFTRRLELLGARNWPRQSRIVELFCGRGSGLRALTRLGFTRISGVDRSAALLSRHSGHGTLVLGDCRDLPFGGGCQDVAIVQGGFHHLAELPGDFERTLREVRRVLRDGGRIVVVEPWQTPFLELVHRASQTAWIRRLSRRLDSLGTMIELEGETYVRWLALPEQILTLLRSQFVPEISRVRFGKLLFVGRKA
jgi:SAM-dependent methyltransferase